MEAFIAYARAHPGELNYASTGIGTSSHLSSYMLASRAGFAATHIPYKGAEALKDLLAGRIQFMFATIPSVIAHIKAGNLAAIAVTSKARSRSLPETPTVADSGFPGFEAGSWFGFFAPRGTPQAVITVLNKAVNDVIAEKAVESRMVEEGADPSVRSCAANTRSGARWCGNPAPWWSDLAGDRVDQCSHGVRDGERQDENDNSPQHGLRNADILQVAADIPPGNEERDGGQQEAQHRTTLTPGHGDGQ